MLLDLNACDTLYKGVLILVIIIFLQRGMVLSSKHALCVYFKLDKLLALEVVSHRVPLATRHQPLQRR